MVSDQLSRLLGYLIRPSYSLFRCILYDVNRVLVLLSHRLQLASIRDVTTVGHYEKPICLVIRFLRYVHDVVVLAVILVQMYCANKIFIAVTVSTGIKRVPTDTDDSMASPPSSISYHGLVYG